MGKPDHTKQLLADALRRLLQTKRYADITVADIVRECGVSRYTFYYHFKDKQDLVNWIYLDTRAKAIKVSSVDTVYDNCQRLISLMKEDAALYVTITLVFLSALFTGLNLYQKLQSMILKICYTINSTKIGVFL